MLHLAQDTPGWLPGRLSLQQPALDPTQWIEQSTTRAYCCCICSSTRRGRPACSLRAQASAAEWAVRPGVPTSP